MRIFFLSLFVVTFVACGQAPISIARQVTDIPSTQSVQTPYPSPTEGLTPIPKQLFPSTAPSFPDYPSVLTTFLNADPLNRERLPALLEQWEAQQNIPPWYFAEGTASAHYDLNKDRLAEIIVAASTLTQSAIIVFEQLPNADYQPSVYRREPNDPTARIWRVEDINADTIPEIFILFQNCGPQTCVTDINILQWSAGTYTSLLRTNAIHPVIALQDTNNDGVQEVVVREGTFGFAGTMTRSHIAAYSWNGEQYQRTSHIPDPVDSQDPYWKIIDGTVLLSNRKYSEALTYFEQAITNIPPHKAGVELQADLYWSVAQFQRMFIYTQQGKQAEAQQVFKEIEDAKLPHLKWSKAFWDTYILTQNSEKACQAAREQAYTKKDRLPAYSHAVKSLGIEEIICFNTLEGLSE